MCLIITLAIPPKMQGAIIKLSVDISFVIVFCFARNTMKKEIQGQSLQGIGVVVL